MKAFTLGLIFITSMFSTFHGLNNGLARTPPMGWMSWQRFRCIADCKNDPDNCISERLYKQMADVLVAEGYRDLGYIYVSIDDCWMANERDSEGRLVPDPERFPSGIKALADYMHERGLKLGIYEDFGLTTCEGYIGSKFYMDIDAQTFADWGIDMLKFDGCNSSLTDMPFGYPAMEFFLNKTGRQMLYSCSWPAYFVFKNETPEYEKIAKKCNTWRNYVDIVDSWESVLKIIEFYGNNAGNFSDVAGPGQWNDPDMIIVGNFGLSYDQQRVQMAMWAILAAPLFMSNDLRNIHPDSKALLLNERLLKINQDTLGIQGKRVIKDKHLQVWTRPVLPEGSVAFAILYTFPGGGPFKVSVGCDNLGLGNANVYNITEVFQGDVFGVFATNDKFNVTVNPSGVVFALAIPLI